MTSLIECLIDPDCEESTMATRFDGKLDTWTVYASSGEHQVEGENLGHAYLRFTESHPDDFVQAIVSSEMKIEGYTAEFHDNAGEEAEAHRLDYPGTYKPSCSRCGCPCGNSDTCGCNDDTGYKSFSDPNVRGD